MLELRNIFTLPSFSEIKGTLISKLGKDTGKIFLSSSLAMVISFIGSMVNLKVLNVDQIGTIAAYSNLVALSTGIALAGINVAFLRFISLYLKKERNIAGLLTNKLFFIELILGLFTLIVIILFAPTIASDIFHKPILTHIIRLAGINILLTIMVSYFLTFFQTYQRFTHYSVFTISQAILVTVSIVIFAFFKILTPENIIFIGITVNIILIIFGIKYYFQLNIKIKEKIKLPRGLLKEIFHFAKWIIIKAVFHRLLTKADIFILTIMVALEQVALYSFANTIYITYRILPNAITTILLPKITSLEKPMEFIDATKKILKYSILISISLIPTFFLIKPLAILFFGEKFIESMPLIYVLLANFVIIVALNPVINILLAINKQKFMSLVTIFVVIFTIVGYIFFISKFGIFGAAITTAIAHSTYNVILATKVFIELKNISRTIVN